MTVGSKLSENESDASSQSISSNPISTSKGPSKFLRRSVWIAALLATVPGFMGLYCYHQPGIPLSGLLPGCIYTVIAYSVLIAPILLLNLRWPSTPTADTGFPFNRGIRLGIAVVLLWVTWKFTLQEKFPGPIFLLGQAVFFGITFLPSSFFTSRHYANGRPSSGDLSEIIQRWSWLGVFAGLIISVATSFRLLALHWWVADLFCNFTVQYILLLPIAILLCGIGKRHGFAILFAAFLVLNLYVVGSYLTPSYRSWGAELNEKVKAHKAYVDRLLVQNVLSSNRNYDLFLDLIELEDPDHIMVIEIDKKWQEALRVIEDEYPFNYKVLHGGNFGIAYYSKKDWNELKINRYGDDELPALAVRYGETWLHGIHPLPPIGAKAFDQRNELLTEFFGSLGVGTTYVVVGDFNMTPWSPWFRKINQVNLFDTGRLSGLIPTWKVFPGWLGGIKIDHVLTSHGGSNQGTGGHYRRAYRNRIGPDIGSDHRAVIVDIGALRKQ